MILKCVRHMTNKNLSLLEDLLRSQSTPSRKKKCVKNMKGPLYTYFYNISLKVLRPTFFNVYDLHFLSSPNIGKIRVKVRPKTNYFFLLYELLHQQN